eukprot:COSAG01_NODE_1829_length_9125_cov_11.706182_4_plen_65_part_00
MQQATHAQPRHGLAASSGALRPEQLLDNCNGQFLCAEGGGGGAVVADRDEPGGWETFELIVVSA